MIRVTDINGCVHEYDGQDLEFESEDVTGHLLVTSSTKAALFAAGCWLKMEMDR